MKTDRKYKDVQEIVKEDNNCLEKMFNVYVFDLNSDGKDEFLVTGNYGVFCTFSGNCDFWVIEKNGEKYHRLLSSSSYLADHNVFGQIKKTTSNKYNNILLEYHIERDTHAYRLLKFDGKKYEEQNCEIHTWDEMNPATKTKNLNCKEFRK